MVSVTGAPLSAIELETVEILEPKEVSVCSLVQLAARLTAACASTTPNPKLWEISWPPPFVDHEECTGLFFRAEFARMAITSRAVRVGSTSRMSAATPETSGVAEEVPPKSRAISPLLL